MIHPVNLETVLDGVTEHWSPKVVGRLNDQYVKVAKLLGEIAWHAHTDEDELFLVVRDRLYIQFEGGEEVVLNPGEFYVVPRGVLHTRSLRNLEDVIMCDSEGSALRRLQNTRSAWPKSVLAQRTASAKRSYSAAARSGGVSR